MNRPALLALLLAAAPALAETQAEPVLTVTANREGITARQRAVPPQLTPAQRASYRQIFLDIDARRFAAAETALANLPGGLLTETARAQIIIALGTGKQTRADLVAWLSAHGDLPQAPRIAQLAAKLPGADSAPLPLLPAQRSFRSASFTPRAEAAPADAPIAATLKPLLAADRNLEAENRWIAAADTMSPTARAQWAYRVAWSYYGQNDNAAALRMGLEAAKGPAGTPAASGAWTAGLAAWRSEQFDIAAQAFDRATALAQPGGDIAASAAYWASRAHLAAGRPELGADRLALATKSPNSLYGLLARHSLGLKPVQDWAEPDFITADWNHLKNFAGARRAAALIEIGQVGLGDRELRHLATTANSANYPALLRLAARLELPATQYQLAVRPPLGIDAPLSARFPAPEWQPARGWRVDKALVFAHALQESNFVTTATSRVGAKGVMQMMPATGREVANAIAAAQAGTGAAPIEGSLTDPSFNIEVGQTYLETLRDMSYTQGLLPKVIAAYNAGPGSVQRWNTSLDDRGDPLLFIESIPFRETRHYVDVVLRNYWMYQMRDGVTPPSMGALATGLWPRFPGMPGAAAIKREPAPVVTIPSLPAKFPDAEDVTVTAAL